MHPFQFPSITYAERELVRACSSETSASFLYTIATSQQGTARGCDMHACAHSSAVLYIFTTTERERERWLHLSNHPGLIQVLPRQPLTDLVPAYRHAFYFSAKSTFSAIPIHYQKKTILKIYFVQLQASESTAEVRMNMQDTKTERCKAMQSSSRRQSAQEVSARKAGLGRSSTYLKTCQGVPEVP